MLRAKGLIATLQSDADNLFVILSAKALKPGLQVSARVASEQSEKKMRLAGADHVFAPYDMTGNRMAQVMLKPHVFQFIDFTTKGSKVVSEPDPATGTYNSFPTFPYTAPYDLSILCPPHAQFQSQYLIPTMPKMDTQKVRG